MNWDDHCQIEWRIAANLKLRSQINKNYLINVFFISLCISLEICFEEIWVTAPRLFVEAEQTQSKNKFCVY